MGDFVFGHSLRTAEARAYHGPGQNFPKQPFNCDKAVSGDDSSSPVLRNLLEMRSSESAFTSGEP
jgi:hypothetical protein